MTLKSEKSGLFPPEPPSLRFFKNTKLDFASETL